MTEEETTGPKSLDEARQIVEKEFLGKHSIHGVGAKVTKNAVRVYASCASKDLDATLKDIQSKCTPFDVDLVIEGTPMIQRDADPSDAADNPD